MTTLEQMPTLVEMPSARVPPAAAAAPEIVYPESDGKPMADNTKQFDTIVMIHTGIAAQFHDNPDVFVAGDLLWYPVERDNKTSIAPDILVAFGRPKGYRGSYLQWREGGIAPQVVFEIISPNNTWREMIHKQGFYERFGVEEYYLYDPDRGDLVGWLRQGDHLIPIEDMQGWASPRLGVTFRLTSEGELDLFHPDGERFEYAAESVLRAQAERQRAEAERQRAETERQRAETEHTRAEQLAAKLRELGVDPDAT
jgi:Uma2 family endonuclease